MKLKTVLIASLLLVAFSSLVLSKATSNKVKIVCGVKLLKIKRKSFIKGYLIFFPPVRNGKKCEYYYNNLRNFL